MKFDIYNPHTWTARPTDINEIVNRKAEGAVGQKVGELRGLESRLKELCDKNVTSNQDYLIAQGLANSNPNAYKLMGIYIEYPNEGIGKVLQDINFILTTWKDVENRRHNWRNLVPAFERLKPFLDKNWHVKAHEIEILTKIKVTGNEAWEAYRSARVQLETLKRTLAALENSIDPDDESESHEPDSYSDD